MRMRMRPEKNRCDECVNQCAVRLVYSDELFLSGAAHSFVQDLHDPYHHACDYRSEVRTVSFQNGQVSQELKAAAESLLSMSQLGLTFRHSVVQDGDSQLVVMPPPMLPPRTEQQEVSECLLHPSLSQCIQLTHQRRLPKQRILMCRPTFARKSWSLSMTNQTHMARGK